VWTLALITSSGQPHLYAWEDKNLPYITSVLSLSLSLFFFLTLRKRLMTESYLTRLQRQFCMKKITDRLQEVTSCMI